MIAIPALSWQIVAVRSSTLFNYSLAQPCKKTPAARLERPGVRASHAGHGCVRQNPGSAARQAVLKLTAEAAGPLAGAKERTPAVCKARELRLIEVRATFLR